MERKEFDIVFVIDGIERGSGAIIVSSDGTYSIEDAEDEFYKTLRKNEKSLKEESFEEWKSKIIDNLTKEQEEILKNEHAKHYSGTDDDMPDEFENYLDEIDYSDLIELLKQK